MEKKKETNFIGLTHHTWFSRHGTPTLPEKCWHSWPQPEQQQRQSAAASSWSTAQAEMAMRSSVTCRKPHRLTWTVSLQLRFSKVMTLDVTCTLPLDQLYFSVSLISNHSNSFPSHQYVFSLYQCICSKGCVGVSLFVCMCACLVVCAVAAYLPQCRCVCGQV